MPGRRLLKKAPRSSTVTNFALSIFKIRSFDRKPALSAGVAADQGTIGLDRLDVDCLHPAQPNDWRAARLVTAGMAQRQAPLPLGDLERSGHFHMSEGGFFGDLDHAAVDVAVRSEGAS